MRAMDDVNWVKSHVERLTTCEESGFDQPWSVEDAPAKFTEKLLAAVVGIEIQIAGFEGSWKVNQNRPAGDREGVVDGLRKLGTNGAQGMAAYVENAKS